MKFRRFLQDNVAVFAKTPGYLDRDRDAERGTSDDDVGLGSGKMLGYSLSDHVAEPNAHVDDHQQRDRAPLIQLHDRQAKRFGSDFYRVCFGCDYKHLNFPAIGYALSAR